MELGHLVDASAVAAGLRNNSALRYGKGTSNRYRHLDFPSSWPAYMCRLCVDSSFWHARMGIENSGNFNVSGWLSGCGGRVLTCDLQVRHSTGVPISFSVDRYRLTYASASHLTLKLRSLSILLIHEAQQGCRDATYEPSRFPVAVPYPSPHRATPAYVVVTSSDLDTSRNKASVSGLSWISRLSIGSVVTLSRSIVEECGRVI